MKITEELYQFLPFEMSVFPEFYENRMFLVPLTPSHSFHSERKLSFDEPS